MSATRKDLLLLFFCCLSLISCRNKESSGTMEQPEKIAQPKTQDTLVTQIGIVVPQDTSMYIQKMTTFVQEGGEDPLKTTIFSTKEITISSTSEYMKASAQAAAMEINPKGGPDKATIVYFKVEDSTAYVLLNIDKDHWAGSSVSIAIIHPIIEKTLLQFSQIKNVNFSYAPEDK